MKKVYRCFFGAINKQREWLNEMSRKGYKLVSVDKLSYTFEKAAPNEYIYDVEFVSHKSNKDVEVYADGLQKKGYKVFFKNINISYSFGKVRYRFYGKGLGKIATNPGNLNKELLIISKLNDGKAFESLCKDRDLLEYYRTLRNAWGLYPIAGIILSVMAFYQNIISLGVVCTMITMFMIGVILNYQSQISKLK